jgi:hypothetical protein
MLIHSVLYWINYCPWVGIGGREGEKVVCLTTIMFVSLLCENAWLLKDLMYSEEWCDYFCK